MIGGDTLDTLVEQRLAVMATQKIALESQVAELKALLHAERERAAKLEDEVQALREAATKALTAMLASGGTDFGEGGDLLLHG